MVVRFFDLRDAIDCLIRIVSHSYALKPVFFCEIGYALLMELGWRSIDLSQTSSRLNDIISPGNQGVLKLTLTFREKKMDPAKALRVIDGIHVTTPNGRSVVMPS